MLVTYEPDTKAPAIAHAGARRVLSGDTYSCCRGTGFPGARELYDEEVDGARACMRCVAMGALPRILPRSTL